MPSVDLTASRVPIYAEPDDAVSIAITVPSGYETGGTWEAFVYQDDRRDAVLATFAVTVVGQVVTPALTSVQVAALMTTGASRFSGHWDLSRTVASAQRTWLKGDFIVDPARATPGNGAQALTVTINEGAIVVTATATGGSGGGGAPEAHAATHRTNGSDPIAVATTSIGGLMSSSDKTKLDGVEAGATGDMTATEIRTALLTMDGAGSGVDADLLDGAQGSSYATAAGLAQELVDRAAADGALAASLAALGPPVPLSAGGTGQTAKDTARDALGVLTPGSPMFEGAELRAARAGWANRGSAPFNALLLGDSNGVGYYASSDAQRWAQILASILEGANGQRHAPGYMPRHSLTNYVLSWTSSGTISDVNTSGLGYGAVDISAPGGYIETTQTVDRFWVRYTTGDFIGAGQVTIDGGAPATVNSANGAQVGGNTWDSGALIRGAHLIRITAPDGFGFPFRFEGLQLFDGAGNTSGSQGTLTANNSQTGTGVRLFNGSRFGSTAGSFAAISASSVWWTDGLDRINPHLVILAFGTNEIGGAQSTATFKANLAAIVSRINTVMTAASRPAPSYLFVVPHGTGANAAAIDAYRLAIIEAADAAGGAVLDRNALVGFMGTAAGDTYGYSTGLDGATRVHLNDKGHRLAGETTGDYLLRAFGHRPAGMNTSNVLAAHQLPAASGTDPGAMSAGDFTKLAGIAAGAQVNPTAAAILASLLTADGAGSALDADLLDGQQGSAYAAKSVTTETVAGTTYSVVAADAGKVKETTNGSAVTVTVDQLTAGDVVEFTQYGAGQITLTAGSGVTLRAPGGLKTRAQYSSLALRWRSATEVIVMGDTAT